MSDTPRTDEAELSILDIQNGHGPHPYVPAELARQLERENDRLRRQVKELAQEISATAREAFAEGQWSARQGDDYGSY